MVKYTHQVDGLFRVALGREGSIQQDLLIGELAKGVHTAILHSQLVQGQRASLVRAQHVHACSSTKPCQQA